MMEISKTAHSVARHMVARRYGPGLLTLEISLTPETGRAGGGKRERLLIKTINTLENHNMVIGLY